MSEENRPADVQDGAQEGTPAPSERMVPESALSKQAADFKAQIAELAQFKSQHETATKKAEEADAIAKQEFDKVLADRDKSLADAGAQLATLQRQIVEGGARDALRSGGLNNDLMIAGALAALPTDMTADGLGDWTSKFLADNADALTAAPTPVKQPGAGSPRVSGGGSDLKSRLNSDDPKVKDEALRERLVLEATGQLAPGWDA